MEFTERVQVLHNTSGGKQVQHLQYVYVSAPHYETVLKLVQCFSNLAPV